MAAPRRRVQLVGQHALRIARNRHQPHAREARERQEVPVRTLAWRVLSLYRLHRFFHEHRLVGIVGRIIDIIEVSTLWKVEAALLHGNVLIRALHSRAFVLVVFFVYLRLMLLKEHIGITQENESKDRLTIFVGCKVGTGTQHISRMPKVVL